MAKNFSWVRRPSNCVAAEEARDNESTAGYGRRRQMTSYGVTDHLGSVMGVITVYYH